MSGANIWKARESGSPGTVSQLNSGHSTVCRQGEEVDVVVEAVRYREILNTVRLREALEMARPHDAHLSATPTFPASSDTDPDTGRRRSIALRP